MFSEVAEIKKKTLVLYHKLMSSKRSESWVGFFIFGFFFLLIFPNSKGSDLPFLREDKISVTNMSYAFDQFDNFDKIDRIDKVDTFDKLEQPEGVERLLVIVQFPRSVISCNTVMYW